MILTSGAGLEAGMETAGSGYRLYYTLLATYCMASGVHIYFG